MVGSSFQYTLYYVYLVFKLRLAMGIISSNFIYLVFCAPCICVGMSFLTLRVFFFFFCDLVEDHVYAMNFGSFPSIPVIQRVGLFHSVPHVLLCTYPLCMCVLCCVLIFSYSLLIWFTFSNWSSNSDILYCGWFIPLVTLSLLGCTISYSFQL